MNGWLLMGLLGTVSLSGISESWTAIGLTLGARVSWKLVAGQLRVHTEYNNNALTLPDYFTGRFEDRSRILYIISALVILLFFTIYCASGIMTGARLFEGVFGMNYEAALWAGAAATIPYTFTGGFLTVSWTDTAQAGLMIFTLILTPVIIIISIGGFGDSLEVIRQKNVENVDMPKGLNFVAIISSMGWGLGYFGQPHILVRFMAADSHHSIAYARRIGMIWTILRLVGVVIVGFLDTTYFDEHPTIASAVNQNAERVLIELVQIPFNPWIIGVLPSTALAAVMSMLSCQLLVCSSVITGDLYKAFLRKQVSQKELVWIGQVMVLVVALVAITLAANPENRVLGLVSCTWAGFGTAFGSMMLLSVVWSRTTHDGALTGMIIGALTVIVWKWFGWLGLYETIPGFTFDNIGIIVFSLLGKTSSVAI